MMVVSVNSTTIIIITHNKNPKYFEKVIEKQKEREKENNKTVNLSVAIEFF